MGVVTEAFRGFAQELLEQRNAGALPLAVVRHPVGGIAREQAAQRITDEVVQTVVTALQKDPCK